MDMVEVYKQLAARNGWDFSLDKESNRPYFMKNGNYATPTSETSQEDKELLANIISEGSDQLERIVLLCWDNEIKVTGPCSGIGEFHDKKPFSLHLGIIGPNEVIEPLHKSLVEILPSLSHMCREQNGKVRYDMNLSLKGAVLSKEQSEEIFGTIANELEKVLKLNKGIGERTI